MSLDAYLSALTDSATLPPTLGERVMSVDAFDVGELQTDAVVSEIERTVSQLEQFLEEQSAETLAGRSVLTLAGLADIRYGARLMLVEDGVARAGGVMSIVPDEVNDSVLRLMVVDTDIEDIVASIRAVADYEPSDTRPTTPSVDLSALQAGIQKQVNAVVKTGEGAIKDLSKTVGWGAVAGTVGGAISGVLERSALFKAAQQAFGWIKRLALRAIEAGIAKLQKAVGDGPLKQFLDSSRKRLGEWLDGGGVGDLLGGLLAADTVAPACLETVRAAGGTDQQQKNAQAAAEGVAAHAKHLGDVTHKVTEVVSWFGAAVWSTPLGAYVAAGFVVAIGAAVWQVQDHLDTTAPFALPDVAEGMISSVRHAVASA
jgi:hypothetical protein